MLLLIFPLFAADYVYNNRLNYKECEREFVVNNLENISNDYVVIGSSRVLNAINPSQIYDKTQYTGLNLGFSGASLAENYLTLSHFLNYNKVNNVLLNVDICSMLSPHIAYGRSFNCSYFLPYMNDEIILKELYSLENPVKVALWKYIPFLKYAEFNNVYSFEKLFFRNYSVKNDFFKNNGFVAFKDMHSKKMVFNSDFTKQEYFTIDYSTIDYLIKIIILCKKNNVKIHFISAPIYTPKYKVFNNANKCYDVIDSISKINNINFYNFTSCYIAQDTNMLYDFSHLNLKGVNEFNLMLSDTITKYFKK